MFDNNKLSILPQIKNRNVAKIKSSTLVEAFATMCVLVMTRYFAMLLASQAATVQRQ